MLGKIKITKIQKIYKMSLLEKKYQPCKVCGDNSAGFHLGTMTCEACKKFFLRNVKSEYKKFKCSRTMNCVITKSTRTTCGLCRFQKCIEVGMKQKDDLNVEPVSFKELACLVCGTGSSGLHFGVITCEGCKGFYRRCKKENSQLTCTLGSQCEITYETRNQCKACRLTKCLKAGMDLKNSKIGRQSNLFKETLKSAIDTSKTTSEFNDVKSNTNINNKILNNETNFTIQSSSLDADTRGLIKKAEDAYTIYVNCQLSNLYLPSLCGYEIVLEYLKEKYLISTNLLAHSSIFHQFSSTDQKKLLVHAINPLRLLELSKKPDFTNYFECDKDAYEKILVFFPAFNSTKLNNYIGSLLESLKEYRLDTKEYALYSLSLILSNGACVDNDTLLFKLNTEVTKALIDYMQLRRNEYESSTQLIKLSGDFEKINLFLQHGIFNKCMELKQRGLNFDKYYEILYFNRWFHNNQ